MGISRNNSPKCSLHFYFYKYVCILIRNELIALLNFTRVINMYTKLNRASNHKYLDWALRSPIFHFKVEHHRYFLAWLTRIHKFYFQIL